MIDELIKAIDEYRKTNSALGKLLDASDGLSLSSTGLLLRELVFQRDTAYEKLQDELNKIIDARVVAMLKSTGVFGND